MKVHYSYITTLGFTVQSRKFEKFLNIRWNAKSLKSFVTPLELFCKDFVDISYENASFRILEDSVWLQFIYVFLTTIIFLSAKYLFPINGGTLD